MLQRFLFGLYRGVTLHTFAWEAETCRKQLAATPRSLRSYGSCSDFVRLLCRMFERGLDDAMYEVENGLGPTV